MNTSTQMQGSELLPPSCYYVIDFAHSFWKCIFIRLLTINTWPISSDVANSNMKIFMMESLYGFWNYASSNWPQFSWISLTCHFNFPIPICFKKTSIIPLPKKSKETYLNDYCPIVLSSTILKWSKIMIIMIIVQICNQPYGESRPLAIYIKERYNAPYEPWFTLTTRTSMSECYSFTTPKPSIP